MKPGRPSARGKSLGEVVAAARMHVEMERAFGASHLPWSADRVAEFRKEGAAKRRGRRRPASDKVAALGELQAELEGKCCCGLGATRTHLVFADGSPEADLMFIGEAPGADEDAQGVPFVGRAGQLLTKIIEAIGLERKDVYIANICKCRPPGNRTPLPDETAACLPYLLRQIELVKPRIIVVLGNVAAQTLIGTTEGITRLRGGFRNWRGIELMPTFHPSYLLRNPSAKREVWDDMKKVWSRMREMGLRVGELKGR